MKYKLKYVFLPYVLLSITFILSYLLMYWFLTIKLNLFVLTLYVVFWLPMILSILVIMFLTPFLDLLKEIDHYTNRLFKFFMVFPNAIFIVVGESYISSGFADISFMKYPFIFYLIGNIVVFCILFFVDIDETYLRLMHSNKFNYQEFIKQRKKIKEKIKREKEKRRKRREQVKKNRERRDEEMKR